ncbi:MAG: MFS transporter [Clostridiales bacterium]|nr:MFS transporter [Clostridiales bacterium]
MKKNDRLWVTAFLLLSMVFLSAVFAVQGSLLSTMIEAYRLDAARQGLANTMAFAGGVLALFCAFLVQGRCRKRTLLKVALTICAAGLVLMWLAPGYGLYTAAWFITGFGLGLMDTLLSACMADLYTGRQAVTMMCILHTAYGLSSVFSPMGYAALLGAGLFWKRVYLIIAAVGLLLVFGALLVRRLLRMEDPEPICPTAADPRRILPALREGHLLWLVAAIFFHGIFLSGLNTWINRYADTLPGTIALPAQSCVFLGLMLSRLGMPFLPIKPEKYVAVGGLLGGAVLCIGLLIPNGWVLRALLMVSSLLFGALIPCVLTLGCGRQPQNTLLATTGIMLALYLGQAVSAPVIAALEAAISLKAGMLLCALCMALCSLCCAADASRERRA